MTATPTSGAGAPLPAQAIGVVRCQVAEGRDEDWGDVVSESVLDAELARGLDGIEDFSHVLVVYWMHQSSFDAATDLVRRPRGRADMPERGIFAQRAKHRPNPIGVTAAAIVARKGAVLEVRGLDAIDGTPVLDLKPYFPAFDRVEGPRVPEWAERADARLLLAGARCSRLRRLRRPAREQDRRRSPASVAVSRMRPSPPVRASPAGDDRRERSGSGKSTVCRRLQSGARLGDAVDPRATTSYGRRVRA